ncbi:DUF3284 domain-containing protein [Dellaglioa algida]|uniref:DUF3284 domain-containing protein n=1 Tax=Dellaglioa algida TaxID=105612 RepID=UPI000BD81A89|nr:DUF3284 domain-containing protein [Dellaglioa algida]MDK1717731.1 DUF3284 domain-containing protein [Dellaglioa algida]MDK1729366.1 DUF3284 domain-containing protein [Dellaglioa algida]MDK1741759.1 DUF3284 domain-containing protein [Dellaglioa algida]SOB50846.1 conserved hypothetical protein [Dellaglioa algida]
MEMEIKLKMPATYLFDQIMESVLYDIHTQTGRKLKRNQLEDFEFTKNFSKTQTAALKVTKIVENESYHFQTENNRNKFEVEYEITAVDADHCLLSYKESMTSKGKMQQMNDVFMSMMMSFFKKRNFKKMMKQIEGKYATS